MTTETTAPAALTEATDEELVSMVATAATDEELDAVLAEIDRRDSVEYAEIEPTEEEQRRALVAAERRKGESLDQTVDRMYGDITRHRYEQAEDACRGHLLNAAGEAAHIDPYTLFHGPARNAVRYASEELVDWWRENGRKTWIEYKAEMLGRPSDQRAAAEAAARTADILR
ncbi:hypothetical protein [Pseudonocardia sp. T1-2H]|uniref:hypothetical protein n=1 Tax=Pseudonocardia sp. T1-2H TaxID=3128899 RepID=UPI003101A96F